MALTLALREAVAGVFLSLEAGYVGILRPSGWQTGAARYGFFSVFFRVQNHDDDKIHFDPRSPKLLHSTCSLSWRDAGGGLVVRNLIDGHFAPPVSCTFVTDGGPRAGPNTLTNCSEALLQKIFQATGHDHFRMFQVVPDNELFVEDELRPTIPFVVSPSGVPHVQLAMQVRSVVL